jgi:HK97 family phage prohead protease
MAKESSKTTFILSEESINSYGFRILTSGIDLTQFRKNPVMLWNHTRPWRDTEDVILPIGHWENLRVEEGKLLGDACFDMEDPFAAKIAGKVTRGVLKACSVGIEVLEHSDASEHVVIGQTRSTVTRCRLREVSITDIPANANAVSLYDEKGNMIELTAESVDCVIGMINNNSNKNEKNMKLIALKLGLNENATEAEILAKVQELQASQEKLTAKENEIAALKAAAQEAEKKTIEKLVNDAIVAKKLTADQKAHFIAIGEKMGVESLRTTLASMNGAVKPTDLLSGKSSGASANPDKKWADFSAKELEALREEDRDAYVALYEKEYGFKPKIK